jgi:predicted house-cleaning NTP pyrophosphatase (Maf/HAM1 superfamily)
VPFRAIDTDVDEVEAGPAEDVALTNARRKARAGAQQARPGELVVAVDTVVALEGAIWGKPDDEAPARATLQASSWRGSKGTTSTSSGCRWGGLRNSAADLQPFLLKGTERNSR